MAREMSRNVTKILIGLHEVGVYGLRPALAAARDAGLADREAVLDLLMERLAGDNYVPPGREDAYRKALWREHVRAKGEDIRDLFSEVEVVVRGAPGRPRDVLVETLRSVLADFELKPVATFEAPAGAGEEPELFIAGESVVRGCPDRDTLRRAVKRRITEW